MNWKKFLLAGVLSSVAMVTMGFVWHTVLLVDFFAQEMAAVVRPEVQIAPIVLGYAILGFLMA